MRSKFCVATVLSLSVAGLSAGELPPEVQAKFIRIIASSAGSAGKVNCKDAAVVAQLVKLGVAVDGGSKVAWAGSEAEVKALKASGHLVICGNEHWLPGGASVAVVEEGGKPQIYLHMGNIGDSGVTLSDAVLKIGRKK
jgi:hypothetical protein